MLRIGIISDTHMPLRYPSLPEAVATAFANVDMIFHAGDVGELWVLRELSRYAPVIAVHGNDEGKAAARELPFSQLIHIAEHRVMLWHGHESDRALEFALRKDDAWRPKLDRFVERPKQAGADILVYGHTHIPTAHQHAGVWLINGGAIASGSARTRQSLRSVAVMHLEAGHPPQVTHYNLATGDVFTPWVDWDLPFKAAWERYQMSILAPELQSVWMQVEAPIISMLDDPQQEHTLEAVIGALCEVAMPCWLEQKAQLTKDDVALAVNNLRGHPHIPNQLIAHFDTLLAGI